MTLVTKPTLPTAVLALILWDVRFSNRQLALKFIFSFSLKDEPLQLFWRSIRKFKVICRICENEIPSELRKYCNMIHLYVCMCMNVHPYIQWKVVEQK